MRKKLILSFIMIIMDFMNHFKLKLDNYMCHYFIKLYNRHKLNLYYSLFYNKLHIYIYK